MAKNRYLLDTNICIALLRGDQNVARKMIEAGEGNCCLSVITFLELMFGAYYSQRKESEISKVKLFASRFPIIPLQDSVEEYAHWKTSLRMSGVMIDEFDLLIAATALSGGYVLVTDNLKHFQRIAPLKIENWINRKSD